MKQNKGFIGIGLIIAIVLGVALVGGGAYYLGKGTDKLEVKNPDINQNQNQPVDDSPMKTPFIIILSPNGGEQLVVGSKYSINYTTNLAPADAFVSLFIGLSGKDEWMKIDPGYPNSFSAASDFYEWTIPKEICGVEVCTPLISGGKYILKAILTGTYNNQFEDIAFDISDSPFTINYSSVPATSCTSDKGKIMTYSRALEIAKTSSCNNVGVFTGEYGCNKNGGGLVDVYMKPSDKPNCGFACRVSIDTGKAEEGWMCTGALKPVDDNLIELTSCGVSLSKTSNWSVISSTSNEIVLDILSTDHTIGTSGINIKCVLSNTITDTDAKFGNITYFYDAGKKAWMEIDDKEGEGVTPNITPVLAVPLFTVNGLPVFRGTGRWLTYIVPISPTSILYLKEGDTEGGQTQSLTNLVKTLKKL